MQVLDFVISRGAEGPGREILQRRILNMKLTGRWFPQIVDRDSGNLYPIYIYIYITKIVVLVSEPVRGRSRATELPCLNSKAGHHYDCITYVT